MDTLLISIVMIALIDSVNPNAIAVQIYLLSTPRPIKRSVSFITGDFIANLIVGLLIISILNQAHLKGLSRFSDFIYIFQLILGAILVLIGTYFNKFSNQPKPEIIKKVRSPKPIYTFFLGITIAFSEGATALPYLFAIGKLAQQNLSISKTIEFLIIYNIVFILPLIALLLLYLYFDKKSFTVLHHIQNFINRWIPNLIQVIVIIFGLVLVIDSTISLIK